MIRRIIYYAIIIGVVVLLSGCAQTTGGSPLPDPSTSVSVSDTSPTDSPAEDSGATSTVSTPTVSDDDEKITDLDTAVAKAMLESNFDSYLEGECAGEGHYIMDSAADEQTVTAYVLTLYGTFSFMDGNLVKTSGSGVIPVVMTFSLDENNEYSLMDYQEPEDGSLYTSSIQELFPEELHDQCFNISSELAQQLQTQERAYAQEYLDAIGRDAVIGEYADFEHPLLTDLGVSVEISNMLAAHSISWNYPSWVGNIERVEEGTRYVYQLDFDKQAHLITYTKYIYDTQEVVEKIEFDSVSGDELTS